jgi:acyl-CoA thioester hydrolase
MKTFITTLQVRVGDLNYGGHLANDRYLLFFHEARVRFLTQLGLSEADIGDGVGLTQVEAFISYQGEAFLGDQLQVSLSFGEFSRIRFRVDYIVSRPADKKQIAAGYTILAAFDYVQRRPVRIPASFIDNVQ